MATRSSSSTCAPPAAAAAPLPLSCYRCLSGACLFAERESAWHAQPPSPAGVQRRTAPPSCAALPPRSVPCARRAIVCAACLAASGPRRPPRPAAPFPRQVECSYYDVCWSDELQGLFEGMHPFASWLKAPAAAAARTKEWTDLTADNVYCFRVRCSNSIGESEFSDVLTLRTPAPQPRDATTDTCPPAWLASDYADVLKEHVDARGVDGDDVLAEIAPILDVHSGELHVAFKLFCVITSKEATDVTKMQRAQFTRVIKDAAVMDDAGVLTASQVELIFQRANMDFRGGQGKEKGSNEDGGQRAHGPCPAGRLVAPALPLPFGWQLRTCLPGWLAVGGCGQFSCGPCERRCAPLQRSAAGFTAGKTRCTAQPHLLWHSRAVAWAPSAGRLLGEPSSIHLLTPCSPTLAPCSCSCARRVRAALTHGVQALRPWSNPSSSMHSFGLRTCASPA